MSTRPSLQAQYRTFLENNGLGYVLAAPPRDAIRRLAESMDAEERAHFDPWSLEDEAHHGNPYDRVSADIQRTLAHGGVSLPGEVYVGVYPHGSFNAQACVVQGGTLLLINTGLMTLVYEVTKCLYSSIRTFTTLQDNTIRLDEPTKEQLRSEKRAEEALASSFVANVLQGDARLGRRQPLPANAGLSAAAVRLAYATETFVVGHEFGHFLAGHLVPGRLDSAPGAIEWIRKSHEQEFEADEIAALLALRMLDMDGDVDNADEAWPGQHRYNAVAGPLLFLAIDHLITRIADEITEIPAGLIVTDHPPSDQRAAALRHLFTSLEGHNSLQLGDAFVRWLSSKEEQIISSARKTIREVLKQGRSGFG